VNDSLIYCSGPLRHCTPTEALGWRSEVKKMLGPEHVADPADRWWVADESLLTPAQDAELVEGDLSDLRRCKGMICVPWKPSFGTPMELVYAKYERILTATVVTKDSSSWVRYHSDYLTESVADACRWMAIRLRLEAPCLR
jgi:hypothetical protein